MRGFSLISILLILFLLTKETIAESRSNFKLGKAPSLTDKSQAKFEPGKVPVYLTADKMDYNHKTKTYTARGRVVIKRLDQTLMADYVEYNYNTQVARANGNVVYNEEGGDNLVCEYLEMNLQTKEGFVKEGKIFYQRDNLYLNGKNIEKLGENRYRINEGEITTCDGKRPVWKFTCKKVEITLEGLAKAEGAKFEIKNIPVAYFPYLIYPAKTKRQSGFLTPSVGSSSTEGIRFDNAYYWAISPNSDATFDLDVATKKGVGFGGEYRYINSETSNGKFYGYYIEEKDSYRREKYSEYFDRDKDRWNIIYEGEKDFDPTFFARAKVDFVSDRQFYHDYGSETYRRTAEKTQSSAFLTKHWEFFNLTGKVEYNYDLLEHHELPPDDLLKDNKLTLQRYPQVLLTSIPYSLPHLPLYFYLDSDYNHFYREKGQKEDSTHFLFTREGDRLEVDPHLLLPLSLRENFFFLTDFGFRQTSYFNASDDEGLDDSRGLFHLASSLSTKFMKIYEISSRTKLRHTIEPEVIYTYIESGNQNDLPRYDELDRIPEENRIALAFTNRFITKSYLPGGLTSTREFLFLRFGQYYDLDLSRDPFSDFFLELRTQPISWLYLKSNVAYDVYDSEFDLLNGKIRFENPRKDYLELEYRYTKSDKFSTTPSPFSYLAGIELLRGGMGKIDSLAGVQYFIQGLEEVDARVRLGLTQSTSLFLQNRRNLSEQKTLETIFGVDYHPQCWGTILSCRILPKTEGRDRETRIMFDFYLKGVGTVGKFRVGD